MYFNTRWMSHAQLKQKLPDAENLLKCVLEPQGFSRPLDGIAYDFDDRHEDATTMKAYTCLELTERTNSYPT